MRIRLRDTPDKIQAFADAFRTHFTVLDESEDYADRAPSMLVRRYLEIELRAEPTAAPSPLAQATDAKRRRDLGSEISVLMNAEADLKSQPWLPLRTGDVVLIGTTDPAMCETYLAEPDDFGEAELKLISSQFREPEPAEWPIPFYDMWFEAGRDNITIIRAGTIIFGKPRQAA